MEKRKKLYAVAAERVVKHNGTITWIPEIIHLHAYTSDNAKYVFLRNPEHKQNYRIVAVGPVIGYHVEDEHGEKLRA